MVISSASLAQSQLYLGRRQQLKSRSVNAGAGSTRARNVVVPRAVASPCSSSSSSSSRHRRCLVGANDAADAAPASLERVHRQTVSGIVAASVALSVAVADTPNAAAAAPSKQGEPSAVQLYETLSSSSSTSSSSGSGSSSGAKKTTKFKQRSLDSGDASYKAKRQDEAAAPTVKVSTKAVTKAVTPKEIPAFAAPRQQEVLLQEAKDREDAANRAGYNPKLVQIRKERAAELKAKEAQREAVIQAKRKEANARVEVLAQEQAAREAKYRAERAAIKKVKERAAAKAAKAAAKKAKKNGGAAKKDAAPAKDAKKANASDKSSRDAKGVAVKKKVTVAQAKPVAVPKPTSAPAPKPASAAAPKPTATTPKPTASAPKPAATASKPAAAALKPTSAASKPAPAKKAPPDTKKGQKSKKEEGSPLAVPIALGIAYLAYVFITEEEENEE